MITTYVTGIFWGERLQWNISLTPEQVLARIGNKNEGSWVERLFVPGIQARTNENSFTLSKMSIGNLPMSGNGFTHVLSGRVIATTSGSKVIAQFRLAIPVFIFTTIWLGLAFLIGLGGCFSILIKCATSGDYSQIGQALSLLLAPFLGTIFLNLFRRFARVVSPLDLSLAVTNCLEPSPVVLDNLIRTNSFIFVHEVLIWNRLSDGFRLKRLPII